MVIRVNVDALFDMGDAALDFSGMLPEGISKG